MMKKISVFIAILLIFALSATASAISFDSVETVHGTHAKPGSTAYSYKENSETVPERIDICPMERFSDLPADIWCHEGLDFVLSRGYMQGKTQTVFAPDSGMTRAMIVTVLHRVASDLGMPESADTTLPFKDTPRGAWYYDALCWAYNMGIAKGFNGEVFAPDSTVTREQITLFISRFAQMSGDDVSYAAQLAFSDTANLPAESQKAISWAVENEILNGYPDGAMRPKNTASRAHFASMLERWLSNRCEEHEYRLVSEVHADCKTAGRANYVCTVCGAEKTVITPFGEHRFSVNMTVQNATCTENGSYERFCETCGYRETGIIPASGHRYGDKQIGKAPTCTEAGTYVKVCADCGSVLYVGTAPKTAHSYDSSVVEAPSCTEKGILRKTCTVCGKTLTEEIPATAHSFVSGKCACGAVQMTAAKIDSLSDGYKVVIYNRANGCCIGLEALNNKLGCVSANASGGNIVFANGEAAVLTAEEYGGGYYFKTPDGRYLASSKEGGALFLSHSKTDALWVIDSGRIKNATANLNGTAQYIECYSGAFTCYGYSAKNADSFVMEFYKVG